MENRKPSNRKSTFKLPRAGAGCAPKNAVEVRQTFKTAAEAGFRNAALLTQQQLGLLYTVLIDVFGKRHAGRLTHVSAERFGCQIRQIGEFGTIELALVMLRNMVVYALNAIHLPLVVGRLNGVRVKQGRILSGSQLIEDRQ